MVAESSLFDTLLTLFRHFLDTILATSQQHLLMQPGDDLILIINVDVLMFDVMWSSVVDERRLLII